MKGRDVLNKRRREKTMLEEVVTEIAPSEATGVDESLFGDAAVNPPSATMEEHVSSKENEQDGQEPQDAEAGDTNKAAAQGEDAATDDGEPPADGERDATQELKVILSIKVGGATIGVQRPSSDPHIETFADSDLSGLAQVVPDVVQRARAGWEVSLKHPAYVRPVASARGRNRRRQAAGEGTTAHTETDNSPQQAMRLM